MTDEEQRAYSSMPAVLAALVEKQRKATLAHLLKRAQETLLMPRAIFALDGIELLGDVAERVSGHRSCTICPCPSKYPGAWTVSTSTSERYVAHADLMALIEPK